MTVDDGFSVLEAGRAEMGTKHSSKAIEVVRVPLAKVIPNPYQPRKTFDEDGLHKVIISILIFTFFFYKTIWKKR